MRNWFSVALICVLTAAPALGQAGSSAAVKAPGKVVRAVYLVPQDRDVREEYAKRIEAAVDHLRIWFRDELGAGTTFGVNKKVVEVFKTSQVAAWYSTNPNGDFSLWFWNNVLAEAFSLTGGGFSDPSNIWVFYIDSDPRCGQAVGAVSGVALLPANDLRGLAGEAIVSACAGSPANSEGVCRWVGGLGHELGHAFGLPHPPACEDTDANTICPSNTLMWLGYRTYPQTYLLPENKTALNQSPFFSQDHLRSSLPQCSGPGGKN